MRKLKHSKFKNSGFLFELLVRQITSDILDNTENSVAERIIREFFAPSTALGKELRLYQLLLKERYSKENRAEKFITLVLEYHTKIPNDTLLNEKYNLVKEIKDNYDINQFTKSPISDYRALASIYKIFENQSSDIEYNPADVLSSRFTLVEHLTNKTEKPAAAQQSELAEAFQKQDKSLRLLSYKILVDKFNDKYKGLSEEQQTLLREYINHITNNDTLRSYIRTQVPIVVKKLEEFQTKDKVTSIKLQETIVQINKIKNHKKVDESDITALMLCYELIKEFGNVSG